MGSFVISEGIITERGKLKKEKQKPQITCLAATPRGEVVQTLASTTSKQRLNRETQAALLRVRTGPETPEGNLSELK